MTMKEKIRFGLLTTIVFLGTFVIAWELAEYQTNKKHFKEIKSYINKDGMQIINIRAFGANGRDKIDDYAAIKEAINEAERFGQCDLIKGSIIYFPKGLYIIKNPIIINPPEHGIIMSGVSMELAQDSNNFPEVRNIHIYENEIRPDTSKTTITTGIR